MVDNEHEGGRPVVVARQCARSAFRTGSRPRQPNPLGHASGVANPRYVVAGAHAPSVPAKNRDC